MGEAEGGWGEVYWGYVFCVMSGLREWYNGILMDMVTDSRPQRRWGWRITNGRSYSTTSPSKCWLYDKPVGTSIRSAINALVPRERRERSISAFSPMVGMLLLHREGTS